MSRAMNDEEVYSEMRKMVAFIKQEALEKAREIKVKADEEFNIEKAKLVRQESVNIENTFNRKVKQVEVQKRITQSNMKNQARLVVLARRQDMVDGLFAEAARRLHTLAKDQGKEYPETLRKLVLEGLFKLMDTHVTIECRQMDKAAAQQAIKAATKDYEETLGRQVTIKLDEENYLPESCGGGIAVTSLNGRIRIQNTLESRLALVSEQMLPEIRVMLFGHSPSRKFFN